MRRADKARVTMLPPRAILAAVDFSESSRTALTLAARMAQHCGAALHVLHAEDPLLFASAAARDIDLTAQTRDELNQFVASSPPAADLSPCCAVVSGSPVPVILDIAQREGGGPHRRRRTWPVSPACRC